MRTMIHAFVVNMNCFCRESLRRVLWSALFVSTYLFVGVGSVPTAISEESSSSAPVIKEHQPKTLKGMSATEVENLFGEPDERRASKEGKETWLYGNSVILFRSGSVTAWSDAGEMSQRQNLASLKANQDARGARYRWKNSWEPTEGPTADDVLERLFEYFQKPKPTRPEPKSDLE